MARDSISGPKLSYHPALGEAHHLRLHEAVPEIAVGPAVDPDVIVGQAVRLLTPRALPEDGDPLAHLPGAARRRSRPPPSARGPIDVSRRRSAPPSARTRATRSTSPSSSAPWKR